MAQLQSFKAPTFVQPNENDKYKLHIAIDFGTDGLGLSYAYANKVYVHSKWNSDKYQDVVKPKTIILLDEDGVANQFGLDAKDVYMKLGSKRNEWLLFERFKMALYDNHIKSNNGYHGIDINNKIVASNGQIYSSEKVFIEAFKHIAKESKRFLRKQKIRVKKEETQWILTVPAIWNDKAKYKMEQWIIKAGLVDPKIHNQCKIVYEPDCASLAIQHQIKQQKLSTNDGSDINEGKHDDKNGTIKINGDFCKGEKYILIDAGGGTVDIACHEIMGEFGVKEVLPPSGGPWGSCYIDDEFMIKLEEIFGKEMMNIFQVRHPNVFVEIIHNFQKAKAEFGHNEAKSHNIRLPDKFIAFLEDEIEENDDIEDIEDIVKDSVMGKAALVSLDYEYLKFDNIVWESMFDHVMDPTIKHIAKLLNEPILLRNCKYLCLVGGLSCSPYFQCKIKKIFGPISKYKLNLIIPQRPILSVVQGAAYFGITANYIKARRLKFTYGITLSFKEQTAKQVGISDDYIKNNQEPNGYIGGCFKIVARKNEEIILNQVKTVESYPTARISTIPILCSDKPDPKTEEDGMELAALHINHGLNWEESDTVTEFHFSETMFRVFSYKKTIPQEKQSVDISYME